MIITALALVSASAQSAGNCSARLAAAEAAAAAALAEYETLKRYQEEEPDLLERVRALRALAVEKGLLTPDGEAIAPPEMERGLLKPKPDLGAIPSNSPTPRRLSEASEQPVEGRAVAPMWHVHSFPEGHTCGIGANHRLNPNTAGQPTFAPGPGLEASMSLVAVVSPTHRARGSKPPSARAHAHAPRPSHQGSNFEQTEIQSFPAPFTGPYPWLLDPPPPPFSALPHLTSQAPLARSRPWRDVRVGGANP